MCFENIEKKKTQSIPVTHSSNTAKSTIKNNNTQSIPKMLCRPPATHMLIYSQSPLTYASRVCFLQCIRTRHLVQISLWETILMESNLRSLDWFRLILLIMLVISLLHPAFSGCVVSVLTDTMYKHSAQNIYVNWLYLL